MKLCAFCRLRVISACRLGLFEACRMSSNRDISDASLVRKGENSLTVLERRTAIDDFETRVLRLPLREVLLPARGCARVRPEPRLPEVRVERTLDLGDDEPHRLRLLHHRRRVLPRLGGRHASHCLAGCYWLTRKWSVGNFSPHS